MWFLLLRRKTLYQRFIIKKPSGGKRVLHAPDARLKWVQGQIYQKILRPLPLLPCVGAYVEGVSCIDNAAKHVGQGVKVGIDLKDFFPSHRRKRVQEFFQDTVGYSHEVAGMLSALCTAVEPTKDPEGKTYDVAFVPQGSPASPTLCNLIAQERIDRQLLAYAEPLGWTYTRYSDDLTFSHPEALPKKEVRAFVEHVYDLINAGGYMINFKKTKIQYYWRKQKMLGIVVNEKLNIDREEFGLYRNILYNCVRDSLDNNTEVTGWNIKHGLTLNAQRFGWFPEDTFILHLKGKVNYFAQVNPKKTTQLKRRLSQLVYRKIPPEFSAVRGVA